MIIFDVAKEFSKYPGGRAVAHGPHSGEEFLLKHIVPLFEQSVKQKEKVVLDFTRCMGMTYGFLDESLGELGKVFGPEAVTDHFEVKDNPELTRELQDEVKLVVENATRDSLKLPMCDLVTATAEKRRTVQDFLEWCDEQKPKIFLSMVLETAHGPDYMYVDWQKYCTKWLGIDEAKYEQEKLQLLARQRQINDLSQKSKNFIKRNKK